MMFWAMGSGIHADVTLTSTAYLNIFYLNDLKRWPQFSRSQSNQASVGHAGSPIYSDPTSNLEGLIVCAARSWCQMPQHILRGLVEFMPGQVDRSGMLWQHKWDVHNIRQVVLILWQISVCLWATPWSCTSSSNISAQLTLGFGQEAAFLAASEADCD